MTEDPCATEGPDAAQKGHRTIQVLGTPVDNVTEADVLAFVVQRIASRRPSQIATVNAEFVMLARSDRQFLDAVCTSDLRTADGVGVLVAGRKRGLSLRRRVGGSDLIWSISEQAARMGHSIFLLGGGPGVAEGAAQRLKQAYPGLIIGGAFAGSPYQPHDLEQIDRIRSANPDVLFVAFGAPQQEIWIHRVKNLLGVPVIMGVGGSFDYVVGRAKRAPTWMQDWGLDWLYRLIKQPWRWRRMLVLPQFALLAALRND